MSNQAGHNNHKQVKRENQSHFRLAPFSFLQNALRRLRFTNFRPLFTAKVLAKPPLWRRSRTSDYISHLSNFRSAAYLSAGALALLIIAVVAPIYLVPEDIEAATKDPNPSTLTFVSSRSTASAELTVTDIAGNFAASADDEKASFSIETNNATGYTLNLKLSSATDTLSKDASNSLAMLGSSVTSDNFTNNSWGVLPSKHSGVANTATYYPLSASGFTMDTTSSANNNAANSYTIGLGLKADYSKVAGTYTNSSVVLEYVANAITYAVYYYSNTTDAVTNLPATQSGSVTNGTTSTSVILGAAPTRTGYTFKGWCLGTSSSSNTTTTDGVDSCTNSSTKQFSAGQSFGIDATKTSPDIYYLYAMWGINTYTCARQYRLQDANGGWGDWQDDGSVTITYDGACSYSKSVTDYKASESGVNDGQASTSVSNVAANQTLQLSFYRNTYALTVSRNTAYISSASATTAAVHGDNYYRWGQNVYLTATASSGNEFTTWSQTSGTTSSFGNPMSHNTYFVTPKSAAMVEANGKTSKLWFQNATSADCGKTMYDNRGTDAYKNIAYSTKKIGNLCWMTRNLDLPGGTALTKDSTNLATGFTLPASSTRGFSGYDIDYVYNSNSTSCGDGGPCYSYYSFYTATAHWGTRSVTSGSSSVDICPKNWRLPIKDEYMSLASSYSTDVLLISNWSAAYSGFYYYDLFHAGNPHGDYWSSTTYDVNGGYVLDFYSGGVNSGGYGNKNAGFAVRCVAKS